MTGDYSKGLEPRMKKTISVFSDNLKTIRAGRANPSILDKITVDYYGVETPINQLATIQVPEARLITIQPWDVNSLKSIEKAILASDIGITPSNDGKVIRLPFPPLTEERRKSLVKDVKKMAEETKVAIRNLRREGIDEVKKDEKNGDISEDQKKQAEDEIQKLTDKYVDQIDEIAGDKEKELMEF